MKWFFSMILICLLIISCKRSGTQNYLQKGEVQLVQPKIIASNTVIDSTETITALRDLKGLEIYYTTDGEEPTEKSQKYLSPFSIEEAGVVKFRAFHPEFKSSESTTLKFYKKGHSATKIKWHSKKNDKYNGHGPTTLINNKKGPLEFSNPEWQGFDSIASASVYFKNKIELSSLDIGYLVDTNSWIFPPSEIVISLYKEDNSISKITKKIDSPTEPLSRSSESVEIPINLIVNSITIEVKNSDPIPDWHEGAGSKGWLFMDEWIFN